MTNRNSELSLHSFKHCWFCGTCTAISVVNVLLFLWCMHCYICGTYCTVVSVVNVLLFLWYVHPYMCSTCTNVPVAEWTQWQGSGRKRKPTLWKACWMYCLCGACTVISVVNTLLFLWYMHCLFCGTCTVDPWQSEPGDTAVGGRESRSPCKTWWMYCFCGTCTVSSVVHVLLFLWQSEPSDRVVAGRESRSPCKAWWMYYFCGACTVSSVVHALLFLGRVNPETGRWEEEKADPMEGMTDVLLFLWCMYS